MSSGNKPLFGGPNKERTKNGAGKNGPDNSDLVDGIGDYGPNGKVRRRMTMGNNALGGPPLRRMGVRAEITWVQNQLTQKETAIAHALEELRGIKAVEHLRGDPDYDPAEALEAIYRHSRECPEPLLLGRRGPNDPPTMVNPWASNTSAACSIQ